MFNTSLKTIAITNRHIAKDNFWQAIENIIKENAVGIILREKDLPINEYMEYAKKLRDMTDNTNTLCILHTHIDEAYCDGFENIHLSITALRENKDNICLRKFLNIGVSIHSISEAIEAEKLGATYILAGHIFATDCKKGLEPRGLEFLEKVCSAVSIPVYGLGGINVNNAQSIVENGASGIAIMSQAMLKN